MQTHKEARNYYVNRAISFLSDGWALKRLRDLPWGVEATFKRDTPLKRSHIRNHTNQDASVAKSAYVFETHIGKGHYTKWLSEWDGLIITHGDCKEVASYLRKHCPDRVVYAETFHIIYGGYNKVSSFYGNRRAKRSGQFYMNHIDEGIYILNKHVKSTTAAVDAFCLHPLFQRDEDLVNNRDNLRLVVPGSLLLAMEYRRVANGYLSPHGKRKASDIELSPLNEVNEMLIADKIQNRKDFENYLKGKVVNTNELDYYFKAWLGK